MMYDCLSILVHWANQPRALVLTLQAETTFEPLTNTLITAKFLGKTEPSAPHMASTLSVEDEIIQGGNALVTVTNEGLCTVAVTNCATYRITIKQGSVIGFIKIERNQGKIESLSETKVT